MKTLHSPTQPQKDPPIEKLAQNAAISNNAEGLAVLKEEQRSPMASMKLHPSAVSEKSHISQQISAKLGCLCGLESKEDLLNNKVVVEEIERLLKERELQLRAEYDRLLERELTSERERFDLIVQNEQMRTSYMLREAHRERQEKIKVLEKQLECKNLAALMYVMCTERSRSKLEQLRLIEDYTLYIQALQDLLIEGQQLIIHLSRGYKTAARVDQEWREKMKKVVGEFLSFIYHYAGGPPETNQFYLDLPKLLKTEAPVKDDPLEDPCDEEELTEEEAEQASRIGIEKSWWETLDADDRPFVVFGDMADFKPPQRREVLKTVKAKKTAPKCWKEYRFNNLCIKSLCENADEIKDLTYLQNSSDIKRVVEALNATNSQELQNVNNAALSRLSFASRRQTALSIDIRGGDMGSLLRIITSASAPVQPDDKSALLGARDSIEILSTTRLRQSVQHDKIKIHDEQSDDTIVEGVKINIGRKMSCFDDLLKEAIGEEGESTSTSSQHKEAVNQGEEEKDQEDVSVESDHQGLNLHTDSLEVITTHVPEKDHKINYERVCPMEECQRLQVDSFMRSLPSYMRANPFTHFQQTYEAYEPCTQEQLDILKERIECKRAVVIPEESTHSTASILSEWRQGIATQTSIQSFMEPCTCMVPSPTPAESDMIFNVQDLIPVKQLINAIQRECMHDERIEFNRFQVVGQDDNAPPTPQQAPEIEFMGARQRGITRILKQHPSLLEIFQANAR